MEHTAGAPASAAFTMTDQGITMGRSFYIIWNNKL